MPTTVPVLRSRAEEGRPTQVFALYIYISRLHSHRPRNRNSKGPLFPNYLCYLIAMDVWVCATLPKSVSPGVAVTLLLLRTPQAMRCAVGIGNYCYGIYSEIVETLENAHSSVGNRVGGLSATFESLSSM